jgi:hypothetical protein
MPMVARPVAPPAVVPPPVATPPSGQLPASPVRYRHRLVGRRPYPTVDPVVGPVDPAVGFRELRPESLPRRSRSAPRRWSAVLLPSGLPSVSQQSARLRRPSHHARRPSIRSRPRVHRPSNAQALGLTTPERHVRGSPNLARARRESVTTPSASALPHRRVRRASGPPRPQAHLGRPACPHVRAGPTAPTPAVPARPVAADRGRTPA